ncbi:MAG: monovalent cation:proton antiporter-2 (CPA2) family protein [Myxococcales bacterium]
MHFEGFFLQAIVYLAASVVAVPIARRLGLGSVLGYLVAGALIGPFALGLVGREGQEVMNFAEFGVVMMLFLVGLELEPARLWRLRGPILGLGGLQVALTAALVVPAAVLLGRPWQEGVAVGCILAMSSTAIVLQTLSEKRLMPTPAGRTSFAVLLFQDLSVIPIFSLLPLLAASRPGAAGGGAEHTATWVAGLPAWAASLLTLAAVVSVVVAGRFVVRPLFRAIANTGLRELFTAASLLLVIAIALLMTKVGLSPALGTFLAGVVLANSEYRHELVADLEPFKGLLLGIFFIAVGASIDFRSVGARPWLIAGLVAGTLALKFAVLLGLARAFRLARADALTFAFALPQIGEFAFVLITFTSQLGLLAPDLGAPLVAVVAITMACTPLLFLVNERLVQPRLAGPKIESRPADIPEENAVIVAGFGRFGQLATRLLRNHGVGTTVLEADADHVDLLRRFGLQSFFGDATRVALLEAAGAAKAKLLLVAIDDREKAVELAVTAKKHFPRLTVLARAWDIGHAHELMAVGVEHLYRETLDTSLRMGEDALRLMGFRAHQAHRAMLRFKSHDEKVVRALREKRGDQAAYVSAAREALAELERMMKADLEDAKTARDLGWDAETLREDVRARAEQK